MRLLHAAFLLASASLNVPTGIPGVPACFDLDPAMWTTASQAVGCAPVLVDAHLLSVRCFVDGSGNVSAEPEEPGGLVLFAGVSTCSIPTCPRAT